MAGGPSAVLAIRGTYADIDRIVDDFEELAKIEAKVYEVAFFCVALACISLAGGCVDLRKPVEYRPQCGSHGAISPCVLIGGWAFAREFFLADAADDSRADCLRGKCPRTEPHPSWLRARDSPLAERA